MQDVTSLTIFSVKPTILTERQFENEVLIVKNTIFKLSASLMLT